MLGHILPGWQCSATYCQDDKVWLHVAKMTLQNITELRYETLPPPPYSPVLTANQLPFFQASGHFFYTKKKFCSTEEVETAFKDFLASKPLEFYCRGINNVVNWWMNTCSGIVFWLIKILFKFVNSGIKINSKIGHYFQNNKTFKNSIINIISLDK